MVNKEDAKPKSKAKSKDEGQDELRSRRPLAVHRATQTPKFGPNPLRNEVQNLPEDRAPHHT